MFDNFFRRTAKGNRDRAAEETGPVQVQREGYDSPQSSESGDDLERWRFAAEIVQVIRVTPTEWSTRIGVFGKWGEGKSTVLRFMSKMLTGSNDVVFTFNPWAIRDWDMLWTEFGDQFAVSLEKANIPFDKYRKNYIERMARKYSQKGEATLGAAAAIVGHGLDKAHGFAFRALKDLLAYDADALLKIRQKLGKRRVIVLIDDLDRAQPSLIPQLLLALRELLDLPGFAFVLAFDDEIVEIALAKTNKAWGDGSDFLEKILDFRFHLPPVTPDHKKRLVKRSIELYCPFIPASSTAEIEDLLPENPRKLKSLIRSMAALKAQMDRHDPDEFHWVDVWLLQMIRQESENLYRAISDEEVWSRLAGVLYQLRDRPSKLTSDTKRTESEPELKRIFRKCGLSETSVKVRVTRLIQAARARASMHFMYAVSLVGRPCAVTWKEFRAIHSRWLDNQLPTTLDRLLSEHATSHGLPLHDVEQEVFDAICDDRRKRLSTAADTQSVEEHDAEAKKAGSLLLMADQFLDGGKRLTVKRFSKLWGQCRSWIAFRRNPTDAALRDAELSVIKQIASSAAPAVAIEIFGTLNQRNLYPDILEGKERRQQAEDDLARILAGYVMDEAVNSLRIPGGVRRLSEPGRFRSIVELLFAPSSMLWNERRTEVLELIRSGHEDLTVYENAREYLLLLEDAFEHRSQIISFNWAESLAKDREIMEAIWKIATSRPIQYRMQSAYLRTRQMLISHGAEEGILPLNEELSRRNEELAAPS